LRVLSDPGLLRQEIEARDLRDCAVCVDEIQKCPDLLDEIQLLIEERGIRFLMTGSSARKLKAAGTNLLGGRARTRFMHPFTYRETADAGFSLEGALATGMLPPHFLSASPEEDLAAYVHTYLTEEIAAEGLTRNLPAFSRFLQTAAASNARMINYTNIASDAQVPRQTVKLWFDVLKDTLIGFELEAFTATVKRKAIGTPKFYFFDVGVVRALRALPPIAETSADFGEFFEHFLFMELRAWIDYRRPQAKFAYWRSASGAEVDFIIDGKIAVEVKSAKLVQDRHLAGLRALREEGICTRYFLVCRDDRPRRIDGIEVLPWEHFLDLLWSGGAE
jgi:predicted AAA+ superfamily ATPase